MRRHAVHRILEATSRVEGQPFDFTRGVRTPRLGAAGIWIGKTNATITARSGTTPGSGAVIVQTTTKTAITATTNTVVCYNFSGQSIPSGKYVAVLGSNPPWIISAEC